jgi:hypothetical protein
MISIVKSSSLDIHSILQVDWLHFIESVLFWASIHVQCMSFREAVEAVERGEPSLPVRRVDCNILYVLVLLICIIIFRGFKHLIILSLFGDRQAHFSTNQRRLVCCFSLEQRSPSPWVITLLTRRLGRIHNYSVDG